MRLIRKGKFEWCLKVVWESGGFGGAKRLDNRDKEMKGGLTMKTARAHSIPMQSAHNGTIATIAHNPGPDPTLSRSQLHTIPITTDKHNTE